MTSITMRLDSKAVRDAFRRAPRVMHQAAIKGLNSAAIPIVKAAKQNIVSARWRGRPIQLTGTLMAAMGYRIDQPTLTAWVGPIMQHKASAGGAPINYGWFVEYGRNPGPVASKFLRQFVQRKLGVKGKEIDRVAFLIARKLRTKRIEPRPFLGTAFEEKEETARRAFARHIERAISQLGGG